MPDFINIRQLNLIILAAIVLLIIQPPVLNAYEGLQKYYIRFDIKTSKNKFKDENLLMVPAENEFRTEKFSLHHISGAISAANGDSQKNINKLVQEDALKTILLENGLKSMISKDMDTTISYEGAILSPINILSISHDSKGNRFQYNAEIEFSPISFPDRWKNKNTAHKFKSIFTEFLELFK